MRLEPTRWFRWTSLVLLLATLFVVASRPRVASADVADEHFARGNEAAQDGRWTDAIAAYNEASAVLPRDNALLSYNLGTAYAHTGELGPATYHLQRSLDFQAGATTDIVEAARFNLAVVRRRVELEAARTGAMVDRAENWWDVVVEALGAPEVGLLSLVCGWAMLVALWLYVRGRGRGTGGGVTGAISLVLGVCFLVPGSLHGLAIGGNRARPPGIVLDARADARDGPGNHRKVEFTLQGGSRVRIVDRTPGWKQVSVPGGLTGWVHEDSVTAL